MACGCSIVWSPTPTRSEAVRALALAGIVALGIVALGIAAIGIVGLGVTAAQAQQPKGSQASIVHSLDLPDRKLVFRMNAETIPVRDADGRIDAEAGVIAFIREGQGGARPVTFVVGGGPGTASAYLQLGALGPWRIPIAASGVRQLLPNAESWLDFTDLVFVDPPGTGLGRLVANDAKAKERVWSVDGDVALLADAVAAWLRRYDRVASPKSLVGQSYGGLRAPRIAESLHRRHGLSFRSLILVSPILDYGWRYHARSSPLSYMALLPSFAATRMEQEGKSDPKALAAAEYYARGQFTEDYLRGLRDKEALKNLVTRVTEITGLPPEVVQSARGRIDEKIFTREFARKHGKVTSIYDPAVSGDDPEPATPRPENADPLLAAMKAAESKMQPVLNAFKDQVLFLKHNLNARAIASLQGNVAQIQSDVGTLIKDMEASITEANVFIDQMQKADAK